MRQEDGVPILTGGEADFCISPIALLKVCRRLSERNAEVPFWLECSLPFSEGLELYFQDCEREGASDEDIRFIKSFFKEKNLISSREDFCEEDSYEKDPHKKLYLGLHQNQISFWGELESESPEDASFKRKCMYQDRIDSDLIEVFCELGSEKVSRSGGRRIDLVYIPRSAFEKGCYHICPVRKNLIIEEKILEPLERVENLEEEVAKSKKTSEKVLAEMKKAVQFCRESQNKEKCLELLLDVWEQLDSLEDVREALENFCGSSAYKQAELSFEAMLNSRSEAKSSDDSGAEGSSVLTQHSIFTDGQEAQASHEASRDEADVSEDLGRLNVGGP